MSITLQKISKSQLDNSRNLKLNLKSLESQILSKERSNTTKFQAMLLADKRLRNFKSQLQSSFTQNKTISPSASTTSGISKIWKYVSKPKVVEDSKVLDQLVGSKSDVSKIPLKYYISQEKALSNQAIALSTTLAEKSNLTRKLRLKLNHLQRLMLQKLPKQKRVSQVALYCR